MSSVMCPDIRMRRLGCATNLYAAHPLAVALEQIRSLGFGGVDLWSSPPIACHVSVERDSPDEVRRALARMGLAPRALTVYFTPMAYRMRALEWAAALGIRQVIFEPAPRADFFERMLNLNVRGLTLCEPGEPFERFIEVLSQIVGRAEQLGVGVALEVPHVYTLTETLDQVERVRREIDSAALGWTFAPPHLIARGHGLEEGVRRLLPDLRVVYLWDVRKDYRYPRDDRAFGTGEEQTPGNGGLDLRGMLSMLHAGRYGGELVVKCHGTESWEDAQRVSGAVARGLANLIGSDRAGSAESQT